MGMQWFFNINMRHDSPTDMISEEPKFEYCMKHSFIFKFELFNLIFKSKNWWIFTCSGKWVMCINTAKLGITY
jgi:hypothetical protein